MFGRSQGSADGAVNALSSTLDDVKAGARAGAVKGAAAGALGVLGAKAADAAQSVASSRGDLASRARKAQKSAGKTLAQAADKTGKAVDKAGKAARSTAAKADVDAKTDALSNVFQMFGKRAGSAAQSATDSGLSINLDVSDIPRLLRGTALIATGIGTIFAPGSALDVSSRMDVDTGQITDQLTDQARQGIDTAADVTQQRIRDLVELAKDALSSLSDALTSGVETAESRMQEALDQTESRLTQATEQAAGKAKGTLPDKQGGGTLRWAFFGFLIGGLVAFLSSPLSGPLGERVMNLRRDLGLGGDEGDDSQYWPSPPQDAATTSTGTDTETGGGDYSPLGKTESWSDTAGVKENTDKG